MGVWLLNLDVDPSTSGDQQVVYASPGETISVRAQYQVWTPPEIGTPAVIWQLFFIYSWPDWPPPSGYYAPLYDGIPGRYPGVTQTKTFQVTVPSTPGTYYLWFCMSQHYSMEQAIAAFTTPLTLPAHAKIVVQSEEVSCDIWVNKGEGANYCIDEPITLCYSVSQPIYVQLWVITSEGARIILEGYDDGTGDCIYATIGPPTGTHTYRIKAIEGGEIVCQDETWVWVEECGAEGEEIKFRGEALSYIPSFSATGWVVQVEQVVFGPPISGEMPVWDYIYPNCDNGYVDPNIEIGDNVEVYGLYYSEAMFGYPEQVRICESDDYYIVREICTDEYEPDDTYQEASWITTDGTSQTHRLCHSFEHDWMKFDAEATCAYVAEILNRSNDHVIPDFYLYDTDGQTVLAYGSYGEAPIFQHIDWVAPADGIYYLDVWQPDHDPQGGSYEIRITETCANQPPSITITEPSAGNRYVGGPDFASSYTIEWTDADPDNNASIWLGRDTNTDRSSGVTWLITTLREDPDGTGDRWSWNLSGVPNGRYYILGKIDDGTNPAVYDYSSGTVTVDHHRPNTPSNPSPADRETGVSRTPTLCWSGGDLDSGDSVTYDIRFGTSSSPPIVKSNHPSTCYSPGALSEDTTYYWKIVARDNWGVTKIGSVWRFTVEIDTTGPSIDNISFQQLVCQQGTGSPDTTTISAQITDSSGVAWAKLYYGPNQTTECVTMSKSGDTYSATIGPFSEVGTVLFYIRAKDNAEAENEKKSSTYKLIRIIDCEGCTTFFTQFNPAEHGFKFDNFSGNCTGISLAALDYWKHDKEFPKDEDGNSFNRWEGEDVGNPENLLQDYCAWRHSTTKLRLNRDIEFKTWIQLYRVKRNASEYENALALIREGEPVVLCLGKPWSLGGHAVLAYEIRDCPLKNEFWISVYDSNRTKSSRIGTNWIHLTHGTAWDGTPGLTFSYGDPGYNELYAESPDPLQPINPEDAPWDEVRETSRLSRQAAEDMQASGYNPKEVYADTLDEGASSEDYPHIAWSSAPFAVSVHWEGSTFKLSLYRPDGSLYQEMQSNSPPLMIEVPSGEPGEWTFNVTAVDVPYSDYLYVAVVGTKPQVQLSLQPDWNLLSLPLVPTDTSIGTVLSSISGNYDLVYAYDGCDIADPWKRYDVNAPPYANDLTNLDEKMGIWIRVTDTPTLTVLGQVPTTIDIHLCEGWNLVGYPSTRAKPIEDVLSSIEGKYTLVYAYDASDTADPWKKYDVSAPPYANDLTEIRSGLGYWIKVSEDCVLTVSN